MSQDKAQKQFDVGGQAVLEGVMMRSPNATAVTVRRPDGSMVTKLTPFVPVKEKHPIAGKPFIRGIVNMVTMLYYGMNTLEDSTKMLGLLDEEPSKFEKWLAEKTGKSVDKIVMGVAIVLAVALALGLFMLAPHLFVSFLKSRGVSKIGAELAGGGLRILLLIGYMLFCSLIPDVRKTFQYHGAEHKSVHCHESGKPLTPENAKGFSRLHPRCGTAFLLIVFLVSIILSICVQNYLIPDGTNSILRLLARLAMLPVVAGLSYELLMGLAHSKSRLACVLRWPGMQMQRLTTREPDEKMLECAIVSVNIVLNGFPENCPKTAEGWGVFRSYQESEAGFVHPVDDMNVCCPSVSGTDDSVAGSSDSGSCASSDTSAAEQPSADQPQ